MGWFSIFSFIVSAIVQHQQQKKAKERQKRAEEEASARADRAKGIEIVAEGEASPIYVVYGRCLVGGIRVYHNTSSSFLLSTVNSDKRFINALSGQVGGKKHEYLTVQQVLCVGDINDCIWMDVEGQDYDNGRFATVGPPSADYINTGGAGGIRAEIHYSGNIADDMAALNYPVLADSKFPNLAYSTSVFRLNRDDPQFGAVPSSKFYIEGRKVRDITESGGVYSLGSRIYSNNPPLVLLDYLTDTLFGKGISLDEIDLESFYKAKLLCNKIVQTNVSCEGKIWSKRSITSRNLPLFEANITLFTDAKHVDNIEKLLDTMDYSELIWTAGKYKLLLAYPLVYVDLSITPAAASATGGIVTINFAAQPTAPRIGGKMLLVGTTMTSTGNLTTGAKLITAATTTSVSFASTATGNLVTAGVLRTAYDKDDIVQINSTTSDIDLYRSLKDDNISLLNTADWISAVTYITDDDIIRKDEIKVSWPNASTRYNFATVRFRNEAKDFAEDSVGWPNKMKFVAGAGVDRGVWVTPGVAPIGYYNKSDYVTYGGNRYQLRFGENRGVALDPATDTTAWALADPADVYRQFIAEDNEVELETDIFAEGIVDYYHALSKAEGLVRNSRAAVTYNFPLKHKFGGLEPNDFLKLQSDFLEIPGELLVVNSVVVDDSGSIAIEATKFDARNLEWNAKDNEIIPQRNIYENEISAVTNLTLLPSSVEALSSGTLTWIVSNDVRVTGYSIRYTTTAVNEITAGTGMDIIGISNGDSFALPSMPAGTKSFVVIPMLRGSLAPFSAWRAVSGTVAPVEIDFTSTLPVYVYKRYLTAPATPTGGVYDFDTFVMTTLPTAGEAGAWSASIPVGTLTLYRSATVVSALNGVGDVNITGWNTPEIMVAAAVTLVADIDNLAVLQNNLGVNYGYASAIGNLKVYDGGTEVTSSTTFAIQSNTSCTAAIDNVTNKGRFSVSALVGNSGYFSIKTTYNAIDRFYNINVAALNTGAVRDTTPPPTPSGITVTTGFSTVFVTVSPAPSYTEGHGHAYTVVYGAEGASPVVGSAVEVYRFHGAISSFPSTLGRQLKLWFKNESADGILSTAYFGPTNGVDATTGKINSADLNLLIIEAGTLADGAVTEDKLLTGAVTADKIFANSVTAAKMAAGSIAVGSAAVENGAITNAMIESLTADKILAGTIQATTHIQVGGKLKLFGDGYIESYAQSGYSTTGDYSRLDSGNLRLYRYVPALGYAVEYAYIRRYETGTAASGDLVTLPGYWKTQPKLLVSPYVLKFFEPAYVAQGQSIICEAQNIAETSTGSMQWRFTAAAYLALSASTINTVLNQTSGPISSNTYSSTPTRTTAANTTDITCNVEFTSVRGNGASQYFYRTVSWRVAYRVSGSGGAYSYSTPKVKSIGATTGLITDVFSFTFPSTGTWEFYLEYTASDESASVFGSISYEYDSFDSRTASLSGQSPPNATVGASYSPITVYPTFGAYSAPGGWTITGISYSASWSISVTGSGVRLGNPICGGFVLRTPSNVIEDHTYSRYSSDGFSAVTQDNYGAVQGSGSHATNAVTSSLNTSYYQADLYEQYGSLGATNCNISFSITALATITRRRLAPNSTTPANTFTFVDYTVSLPTAQILATGTLNWMAIGD